jgi:hypothetical protein
MDKIIQDTSKRLISDIKADNKKWYNLWQFLEELDIVKLSNAQYDTIWKTKNH